MKTTDDLQEEARRLSDLARLEEIYNEVTEMIEESLRIIRHTFPHLEDRSVGEWIAPVMRALRNDHPFGGPRAEYTMADTLEDIQQRRGEG